MTRPELQALARDLAGFAARAHVPLDRAAALWPAGRALAPGLPRQVLAEARREVVLGALARVPLTEAPKRRRPVGRAS